LINQKKKRGKQRGVYEHERRGKTQDRTSQSNLTGEYRSVQVEEASGGKKGKGTKRGLGRHLPNHFFKGRSQKRTQLVGKKKTQKEYRGLAKLNVDRETGP